MSTKSWTIISNRVLNRKFTIKIEKNNWFSIFRNGILRSGGATNNYTAGIVTSLLKLGLVKQILQQNLPTYGVISIVLFFGHLLLIIIIFRNV